MESTTLPSEIVDKVKELFQTQIKVSVYTTGTNSHLASWLTLIPGASKSIVEIRNHYAYGSTLDLLEFEPDKWVSPEVTIATATAAYINTQRYLCRELGNKFESFNSGVLTIGCSGALRSNYDKKGDHHAYITFMDEQLIVTYYFNLSKATRTREEEDWFLSMRTLELILLHAQKKYTEVDRVKLSLGEGDSFTIISDEPTLDVVSSKLNAQISNLVFLSNGRWLLNQEFTGVAIFPGSFNPLHSGHIKLAEQSAVTAGLPVARVLFEISLNNLDKELIAKDSYQKRVKSLLEQGCNVMVTMKPYFIQKNEILRDSFFIMGADTLKRITDKKYYENSHDTMIAKLSVFQLRRNKFVVAPRKDPHTEEILTVENLTIPTPLKDIVLELKQFRMDISSTLIRTSDTGKPRDS